MANGIGIIQLVIAKIIIRKFLEEIGKKFPSIKDDLDELNIDDLIKEIFKDSSIKDEVASELKRNQDGMM